MSTAYIIENRILFTRETDTRTRVAQRMCGMLRSSIVPSPEGLYRTVGYTENLLLKSKGLQHVARYTDDDEDLTWAEVETKLGLKFDTVINIDTGLKDGVHSGSMRVTALDPRNDMRMLWDFEMGTLLTIEAPSLACHGRSPIFSFEVDLPCDPSRTMLHVHEDHLDKLQRYGQALFERAHDRAGRQMAGIMKLCIAQRARWLGQAVAVDERPREIDPDLKAAVERASRRAPLRIAA